MYYVYCPTHDAKVLLFHDQVRQLANTEHGIVVHLECYDGTPLVWEVGRGGSPAADRTRDLRTAAA